MPEARNGKKPVKSSLASPFHYKIKVEMYTYPFSATPTQLKPFHFQVSLLLRFRKMHGQNAMDTLNVRTARWVTKVPWHGGTAASMQLSTGKQICSRGLLVCFYRTIQPKFPAQNQIYGQPVVLFPGNLEIPRIFLSIGHTISPDAQPQFLTWFKSYPRVF